MSSNSRRVFLGQAAVAAASLFCANSSLGWGKPFESASSARAWVTSADQKFQPVSLGSWRAGSTSTAIAINPARRFQSIVGFGGAFTDSSCYLLSQMQDEARTKLLNEFVGPDGLRLSMGRTCIGASDYARSLYSFDDSSTPDPDLKHFSIEHDRAYILPTLRAAHQANPEMYYFSSPWSPPGWMKAGGSMLGGSMRNKYFGAYADYFVKFIEGYRAAGVK